MKKILLALLCAAFAFSSCVEQMEEVESTRFAGIWAVVDEYDMASTFYVFSKGYITEYKSLNSYYIHDDSVWGVSASPNNNGSRYKYSVTDGVLQYFNFYNDVQVSVVREGNELLIGDKRCLLVKDVKKSYYSQIVMSETNMTQFTEEDKSVVWDFEIVNPLYGYEVEIRETPQWCKDVTLGDGNISFAVEGGVETRTGKFVIYYPTAGETVVDVKRGLVEILVEDTYASFRHNMDFGQFKFTILNGRKGVNPTVSRYASWIKSPYALDGVLIFKVDKNSTFAPRSSIITLSYDEVVVDFEVTQATEYGYGFWIGEWSITGQNGLVQKVRISEKDQRESFYMTGYGGLSDEFKVVLSYDVNSHGWELKNQIIGQVDLPEGNVADVWIYGGNGNRFSAPEVGASICSAISSSSSLHELNSSSVIVNFISLTTEYDGEWLEQPTSGYPTFPATLSWAGE